MSFESRVPDYLQRVEDTLDRVLPGADVNPSRLHEAMRYSVLGGGKRVRPLLIYATGEVLGLDLAILDGPAAAIELIHAYSLVHDDLPAMDDDDLRRGQPTTHKKYDEATAILVGDALQALAFEIIVADPAVADGPATRTPMVAELARACGSQGMTGGQVLDLYAEGQQLNQAQIEEMYRCKTGLLIQASVELACLSAAALSNEQWQALRLFAARIGLAFQIWDDMLDIEGDTSVIGKPQGADIARDKATWPAMLGLETARARVEQLYAEANAALEVFADAAEALQWMADMIVRRDR